MTLGIGMLECCSIHSIAIVSNLVYLPDAAQQLSHHYLLSGDASGIIMLWEVSLTDGKVTSLFFY